MGTIHDRRGSGHAYVLGLALLGLGPLSAPASAGGPLELSTELVVDGLTQPVLVAAPRGDAEHLWIGEQSGLIRLLENDALLPQPFLDLSGLVTSGGERGLLGLAFHPEYALNGRFYVTYNDLAGDIVLQRWRTDPGDPTQALAGSGEVLLSLEKDTPQHNGGSILFGNDGMLYMSVGDGSGDGDPDGNAQALDTLFGKLLRLDVDGGFPYAIPPDNPMLGTPGARREIWAYGLRNPWRVAIDRLTGDLYIADVGGSMREEIDLAPAGLGGLNFGWRCMEGSECLVQPDCGPCPAPGYTLPLHEFDHSVGCAVIGGAVYRGQVMPGFTGRYLFADYCTGKVWSFLQDQGAVSDLQEHTTELSPAGSSLGFVSSLGSDGLGELYVVSLFPGAVRRIVPAPPVADCDGDGISDADEIAAGAFDVNANGVPDTCEVLLTASPFVLGEDANLTLIGAEPGQLVGLFVTNRGIGPAGPCFFGGAVCLDLLPFVIQGQPTVPLLALLGADSQGVLSLDVLVPDDLPDPSLYFQMLLVDGQDSGKSNPVPVPILPR